MGPWSLHEDADEGLDTEDDEDREEDDEDGEEDEDNDEDGEDNSNDDGGDDDGDVIGAGGEVSSPGHKDAISRRCFRVGPPDVKMLW